MRMRQYRRSVIEKLDSLLENDPKKYWSLLEKLTSSKDNNVNNEITPDQWFD